MHYILLALSVPLFAILNRVRGGGFGGHNLPGHPRFYVSAAIAGWAFLFVSWPKALAFGICYLLWSMLPWGRWYDLGRLPSDFIKREPDWFEKLINKVTDNDHVAFTIRNTIAILPAIIFISPWFAILPVAQTACYELGWRFRSNEPIQAAEIATGAVWGLLFALTI